MSLINFAKVTTIPTTPTADTVYFKNIGTGVEVYVSSADASQVLPLSSSGGSSASYVNSAFPGALTITTGTVKWYPPSNITFKNIEMFASTPSTGADITINLLKNGVVVGTYSLPAAQGYISQVISFSMIINDYLTIDITGVGSSVSGSDLQIRLTF